MPNRKCKLCGDWEKGHDYYVPKTRGVRIRVFVCDRCFNEISGRKKHWSKGAKRSWKTRRAR
jgi:ribosome-binding protein aMBF1 (putative translation factor)